MMGLPASRKHRRLLTPEVIQPSATDCGVASLKSFLSGFRIQVDYEALREFCHTDVDGTSIDVIEDLAVRFGLDAQQVLVPMDNLFHPDARALPAIIVTTLPDGANHFIVLWRSVGKWVQVMDPGQGRRWLPRERVLEQVYEHSMALPATRWREWAGTEEFVGPLSDRMLALGLPNLVTVRLLQAALDDSRWQALAGLDAATRLVASLVSARALRRGAPAGRLLARLCKTQLGLLPETGVRVPGPYWSVQPAAGDGPPEGEEAEVLVRGAVLVRAGGIAANVAQTATSTHVSALPELKPGPAAAHGDARPRSREPEQSTKASVLSRLWDYLKADGLVTPAALMATMPVAALATIVQALLFQSMLEAGKFLGLIEQRISAVTAVVAFAGTMLVVELFTGRGLLGLGRRSEVRFRMDFLRKIPRLADRYFRTRLTSDLTERIHAVTALRGVPALGTSVVEGFFALAFTAAGLIWLDPSVTPYVLLAAIVSLSLPFAVQPVLGEMQYSVASYRGAMSRYYLDALRGAIPLRTHGAEHTLKTEHDGMVSAWAEARIKHLRASLAINLVITLVGTSLAGLIVFVHLAHSREGASMLLLIYWAQQLPALGRGLAGSMLQYPAQRAIALRLLEPLDASEDRHHTAATGMSGGASAAANGAGVAIQFENVGVSLGSQTVLEGVSAGIPAGSRCAVVGRSGAGKTTLLGLLLGWHVLSSGAVRVDGRTLDADGMAALHTTLAWIDPQVQIWNQPLIYNLTYGLEAEALANLAEVIGLVNLKPVIQRLPQGLDTPLGEGGGLLSEGEGQRVRVARAMLKRRARLVLMDEPFRGLDRQSRRELLAATRQWWPQATVLCVTHEVMETADFDHVLVLEGGRIVEQGSPDALLSRVGSRYRQIIQTERELLESFEDDSLWRRFEMLNGTLRKGHGNERS